MIELHELTTQPLLPLTEAAPPPNATVELPSAAATLAPVLGFTAGKGCPTKTSCEINEACAKEPGCQGGKKSYCDVARLALAAV